jgi:hypothetical protein
MGVSVRTDAVRYTEWRDWKSGATLAKELYATESDACETRNRADDPALAAQQTTAQDLLRTQFAAHGHP